MHSFANPTALVIFLFAQPVAAVVRNGRGDGVVLPSIAAATTAASSSTVTSVLTNKDGDRFKPMDGLKWGPLVGNGSGVLVLNTSDLGQEIFGFGTALTESAAYNFAALSAKTRTQLIEALWAPPPAGNGYTVGRMHLGSADFSLATYSLADTPGDYNMTQFDTNLTVDERYVLPLARAARAAAGGDALRLFFSPWSPPAWLKNNSDMIDSAHPEGLIQTDAAGAALAQYFVKFAKSLSNAGVPVWGATLQNEPLMVMQPGHTKYEACAYTAESQAAWLRDHLGPAIRGDNETAHMKLLAYDWNKGQLADWGSTVRDQGGGFEDGFAVHWYQWGSKGLELDDLAALQKASPNTFVLATEACIIKHGIAARLQMGAAADSEMVDAAEAIKSTSSAASDEPDAVSGAGSGTSARAAMNAVIDPPNHDHHGQLVGDGVPPGNDTVASQYAAGELYALDLLGDLRYGVSGWVDWNAVLDYQGGPNHINRSDIGAPILVDAASDSYYVQSPYYYVGHVSRYVPPGAFRVSCAGEGFADSAAEYDAITDYISPQIHGLAPPPQQEVPLVAGCFVMADKASAAVVVMNPNSGAHGKEVTLTVPSLGSISAHLPAHSIKTFTFAL